MTLNANTLVMITDEERREIRVQAIASAAYCAPEMGAFADDDPQLTERVVKMARRFETFVLDGI